MSEDERAGWYHQCHGHELGQTPGERGAGRPGALQSIGSQKVRRDWATEQQQQIRKKNLLHDCLHRKAQGMQKTNKK